MFPGKHSRGLASLIAKPGKPRVSLTIADRSLLVCLDRRRERAPIACLCEGQ